MNKLFNSSTSAADRFSLLPNNEDFIFDFNQEQQNPGLGGQLVAANRKTFPALVGSGAGMALGRVDGKFVLQEPSRQRTSRLKITDNHVPDQHAA